MRYRPPTEADQAALAALDRAIQRHADPAFDTLPGREQEARLHTSQPALKFYERSEHSFVAAEGTELHGFALAQAVWQGDRPLVLVRTISLSPGAPLDTAAGLLHAVIKSAYDAAVYEVHLPVTPQVRGAAAAEGTVILGTYGVCHLGTRTDTAPGERLRRE